MCAQCGKGRVPGVCGKSTLILRRVSSLGVDAGQDVNLLTNNEWVNAAYMYRRYGQSITLIPWRWYKNIFAFNV